MTPEHAWQSAVGLLQLEMPKATFDTWVRDARLVSFADGVFTIGVFNAYAKEWLESRLTSTFERSLAGMLGQTACVQFVVQPATQSRDETGEVDGAFSDSEEEAREMPAEHIELLYLSLRDEIIRPERVVVIPGYFKRWLPYLGPTLSWMVVAFRQILYLRSGGDFKTGYPFAAAWSELCKWSGLSRATIGRNKDDPRLGWFLTRVEQSQKWEINLETGRPKQKTSVYQFIASMPLTPGDQDALYERLLSAGFSDRPVEVLEELSMQQPRSILPYPPPALAPSQPNRLPTPRSVDDVVRIACSETGQRFSSEISQLTDRLADRLMPPSDKIVLTHYFLQNHVRQLGPGPAWMVALLRDEVYYNSKTGELRDVVWVGGGYQGIANRLGLNRQRTVSEWIPPVFSRTRKKKGKDKARRRRREQTRDQVSQYLEVVDHRANDEGQLSLKFRVCLTEPFAPVDQAVHDLAFAIFRLSSESGGEPDEMTTAVQEWDPSPKDAIETLANKIKDAIETRKDAIEHMEDADDTLIPILLDAIETLKDAIEVQGKGSRTRLRLLKHLINHLQRNHFQTNSSTTTSQAEADEIQDAYSAVVVGEYWDFKKLLHAGGMAFEKVQPIVNRVSKDPNMGLRLIAWCLYGYANKSSPERQGIDAPVLFAASRFSKNQPESNYIKLAGNTPTQLARMISNGFVSGPTRSQRKILDALRENGFLSMLDDLCS